MEGRDFIWSLNLTLHGNHLERFSKTQVLRPHLKPIESGSPQVGRWEQESVLLISSTDGSDA